VDLQAAELGLVRDRGVDDPDVLVLLVDPLNLLEQSLATATLGRTRETNPASYVG